MRGITYRVLNSYVGRVVQLCAIRGSGLALQLITSIVVARQLGLEGFGIYTYTFTWIIIIGLFSQMGVGPLAAREVAKFQETSLHSRLKGFLYFSLFALLFGLTTSALLIFILDWVGVNYEIPLWILIIGVYVQGLILAVEGILSGMQKIVQVQLFSNLLRPLTFLITILLLQSQNLNPTNILLVSIITSAFMLFVCSLFLRKELRIKGVFRHPASFSINDWTKAASALLWIGLANVLLNQVSTLMVGHLLPSSDVGLYRAASRGVDFVVIAVGLVLQLLSPTLSRKFAGGVLAEVRDLITQAAWLFLIIGLSLSAVLFVFAESYLQLFGEDFVGGVLVIRILLIGQIVSILTGPCAVILVVLGREWIVLCVTIASIFVNSILVLVLIEHSNLSGAAWGTTISIILLRILMFVLVIREGFNPTVWRKLKWR